MTNGRSDYWSQFRAPAPLDPAQRVFDVDDLKPGWEVVEAGGASVGTVRNVDAYLVVQRGLLTRDLHLPLSTIRSVSHRRVEINVDVLTAERHGWDRRPNTRG